ncbi:neurotransmitter-gated ion-channel ligand binding domain-containing protein [Ditylenchus destructor]|uniref:Neurotransmitter-gated ion-channel ligand binding domain-containing protein n=1 Tax=Ditylenchus destructor TaxID=166010 RepID=A0AAD4R6B9_9BILA|nr:neurotransmitter-gated ion-channel ligand binding domain-containing protein [Ditylenchus destructor]
MTFGCHTFCRIQSIFTICYPFPATWLIFVFISLTFAHSTAAVANKDAARLFEDLLADYNKLVRPVENNTATLVVKFKLKLSQLLDVHEKNQIMTTNVWLQHSWTDHKLRWEPREYGGVDVLYVPSEMIWLPDIVLYNNADGNYQVTIMTKAKLTYNGTVEWSPPAIYKSMCQIDVEWFPFDAQTCEMKFGSWTYGGLEVDLKHKDEHLQREEQESVLGIEGEYLETIWVVNEGIDLSDYYPSVEWDILRVPGKRHEKRYPCCESPFIDLTYEIYLRRKTLFYTVNLMIPCVGISFLTALVFYLPSDGGEKISLCISILISLTVFFLLLVEIIPSTSLVIPLIGKYLLFTMVLVTLSVIVTVITLNVHYRAPSTHKMSSWMRRFFIETLPTYLLMRRPQRLHGRDVSPKGSTSSLTMQLMPVVTRPKRDMGSFSVKRERNPSTFLEQTDFHSRGSVLASGPGIRVTERGSICHRDRAESFQGERTPIRSAVDSVTYIADHFRSCEDDQQIIEDWKYVSVVMDRIFLILFTLVCLFGTAQIIFRAPTIYDSTPALA